ncbi:hypothetical protein O6H91_12G016400 [Diphasiastrum complanatum]|uniref:Uncharacterized protein n=1 Tax=Diphasiastrum complanatum TaxID=34168 RepID=A0ACC2BZ41_DIPCM|nr:hypothetical protein O6H91_12G016400 [Diphasiastrum complanatum]
MTFKRIMGLSFQKTVGMWLLTHLLSCFFPNTRSPFKSQRHLTVFSPSQATCSKKIFWPSWLLSFQIWRKNLKEENMQASLKPCF